MSKVIVVVALASEAPELIKFSNVRLTGLGKVNAARSTTEIILLISYDHIQEVLLL